MKCETKGYQLLSLGSFSNMKYGKMPKKDMVKENGKYPVFSGYRIVGYCDECNLDEQQLIVIARGVGGTGDVKLSPGACYLTNLSIAVIIDENIALKQYLFYYFQKHNLRYLDSGSAQSQITIADLKNIVLPIPSLEIQSKIVAILSSFDDRIELNNKINKNLEQQAAAIFKSWFIDYLPYGGIVPNEWRTVTLDDITSLMSRGINPQYSDNTEQIVINQKCIRNHMLDLSLARTHTPKTINEKWLQFGDLLINSTGTGTLGRVAQVWFEPKNLTVDSHITIVRPLREDLIFYIGLWGILHENMIESLHTGSTGQTELPREMVKAIELLLPDNETLNRFNAVIAPIAATIVLNQEENQKLAQIRDILLPKLMSGELTVSNF